jgi:hypothetical protein
MRKAGAGASNVSLSRVTWLMNNNDTSSQKFIDVDDDSYGLSSNAIETASQDTTANFDLYFVAYCGDAADTMALESYTISLVRAR